MSFFDIWIVLLKIGKGCDKYGLQMKMSVCYNPCRERKRFLLNKK